MKSRIAVVLLLLLVSVPSFATSPTWDESQVRSGCAFVWDAIGATWRALAGTPDGSLSTSDARGRVGIGVPYYATLSTSTPTLLSSVASITLPCVAEISWLCPVWENIATTTAATLQKGHFYTSGSEKTYVPGVAGWDRAYLASTTTGALTVTVFPSVP